MKRKNKIIISTIVATLLFVVAIAYTTIKQPNKEVSGNDVINENINGNIEPEINDIDIILDDSDIEELQIEKKASEEPELSDLKNYFDTAIYLPTEFPYSMECDKVNYIEMFGNYIASVDYCSEDKQTYLLLKIQPENESEDRTDVGVPQECEIVQNRVCIDDSAEVLRAYVSEDFTKALLFKDGLMYEFVTNVSVDELITIVESMESN